MQWSFMPLFSLIENVEGVLPNVGINIWRLFIPGHRGEQISVKVQNTTEGWQ
jgi:hypothetical protein